MRALAMFLALAWLGTAAAFAQQQRGAMFLDQWDANSDGQVTREEVRQHRAEMFEQDSDGLLLIAERARIAEFRSQMQQAHRESMGAVPGMGMAGGSTLADPAGSDADGDGAISRDEFVRTAGAWFQMADRDGNGRSHHSGFRAASLTGMSEPV
ncbi:EF hand [[Luteovulum] sphaeroides subsp. megalophilum]|uniref:hypothetical protein n=1 Tax=Cereibacter sphaeroides TaxID=1063 RepID=UPI000B65FDAA|nr:hypothetical protein [Cereibacter sphaeroides]SNT42961.1 EF hand [[Luteovulum] sphaeroides subsp. megalophilum]